MMNTRIALASVLAGVFLLSLTAAAQHKSGDQKSTGLGEFRKEFLSQLDDVEKKLEDLAQAMPDDKYSWRPMEGVRSVSEVYMHIAGANYMFSGFIGVKRPEGLERDMEKNVTTKPKVLEALKASFDHIRSAVKNTPDESLSKPAKMFGEETTYMGVIFTAATHMHEHLGQSIAYARMNKIVPPWTAAEQAPQTGK